MLVHNMCSETHVLAMQRQFSVNAGGNGRGGGGGSKCSVPAGWMTLHCPGTSDGANVGIDGLWLWGLMHMDSKGCDLCMTFHGPAVPPAPLAISRVRVRRSPGWEGGGGTVAK